MKGLRFQDLALFEAIARQGSLASAGRALGLRAPFVTKALRRIEVELGASLVKRASQGIELTAEGTEFLNLCKQVNETVAGANWNPSQGENPQLQMLTAVGPMFLLAHAVAPVAYRALKGENVGLRLIDMIGPQILAASLRDRFELAFHLDELAWPRSWKTFPIGTLSWVLCAGVNHPLGVVASEKEVLRYPFVVPGSIDALGQRVGNDQCPVPPSRRIRVAEASSGEIGLRVLESTDQLIYVPRIQARELIQQKRLKVIDVKDWEPVRRTAYLSVHQDKLKQSWVRLLLQALEGVLN